MKQLLLILLLGLMCTANLYSQTKKEKYRIKADNSKSKQELRHVVMFGFNTSTSPEKIKEIEMAFASLPKKIKEIKSFEWGTNNSPENLNQGLTHCFFVTFRSEADRDAYIPHPEHQAFVKLLDGHIEKVTVLDYWAKK
jgi:hypothetical protein